MVEFFGIAIQVNTGVFQGISVAQNPGVFQGMSVSQNPGVFQGVAVAQNPTVFQGIGVNQNPTVFQGVAIQQGVPIPLPPEPGCPGMVLESYLSIVKGQNNEFLTAYNATGAPIFSIEIDGVGGNEIVELLLGSRLQAGLMKVAGPECRDAICLEGQEARIIVGCEYMNGQVLVRNARNDLIIRADGRTGAIEMGGLTVSGDLRILSPSGQVDNPTSVPAMQFHAGRGNLELNGNGLDGGQLELRKNGTLSIRVNGDRGELELANADFAEDFDIADVTAQPGMVMVTGPDGALRPSTDAYDSRIAGVLSGAGTFSPAIILDKQAPSAQKRSPVALIGKTWCWADATEAAIEPGDLLTSSPTPGHAMKVLDPERAFGACLGKALKGLPKREKGLIPIRVSLL